MYLDLVLIKEYLYMKKLYPNEFEPLKLKQENQSFILDDDLDDSEVDTSSSSKNCVCL